MWLAFCGVVCTPVDDDDVEVRAGQLSRQRQACGSAMSSAAMMEQQV